MHSSDGAIGRALLPYRGLEGSGRRGEDPDLRPLSAAVPARRPDAAPV